MTAIRFIEIARGALAYVHELWQWFGTLQPAAVVAFGSFTIRERTR